MATFISGQTDIIPENSYTPDFAFLERMQQKKRGLYEQGKAQISAMQNSVLNAEVVSDEAKQKKMKYMQQAEKTLKEVSQLDLSLPENVQRADDVYKDFWSDEDLLQEIGTVKYTRNQQQIGQQQQYSTDKDTRALYNSYSIQDLDNYLQEYAEATPDERKRMSKRSYVNNVDVNGEIDKKLNDLGIKDAQVVESVNGKGYKIVDKFGKTSMLPLRDFYMNSLSPDARAQLQVMGRLESRSRYNNAYAQTGNRDLAKNLMAEDLINKDIKSYKEGYIPELENSVLDATDKITGIMLAAKSQNRDLSKEESDKIKEYTTYITNTNASKDKYKSKLEGLENPESDTYKETHLSYKSGLADYYMGSTVSNYAMNWAQNRANLYGSRKIEEDKTYVEGQKMINDWNKANLSADTRLDIANESNQTKLAIKGLAGEGRNLNKTGGTSYQGPIYVGQSGTANAIETPHDQFQTATVIARQTLIPSVLTAFQKTINNDLGFTFINKLNQNLTEGNGSKAFMTKNTPEYNQFMTAVKDGKIIGIKQGDILTNDVVYNALQTTLLKSLDTDGGMERSRQAPQEIEQIKKTIETWSALENDRKTVAEKVLSKKEYEPYLITDSQTGSKRLMTDQEFNSKYNDFNKYNVYGDAVETATKYAPISSRNLGPRITVSNSPDFKYKQEGFNKIKQQFYKDFNKIAPGLTYATANTKENAINFGTLRYSAVDDKSQEAPEIAASQLFSPENLNNLNNVVQGVDPSLLKPDGAFSKLLASVGYLASTGNSNIQLEVEPYNTATKKPIYKVVIPDKESLIKLLGKDKSNVSSDETAAIDAFMSPAFKISASNSISMPGGIKNAMSPLENQLRNGSGIYESDPYWDKAGMGSFKIEKLSNGNFGIKIKSYIIDQNTGQKVPYDFAQGQDMIEVPASFDAQKTINDLFNILKVNYDNVNKYTKQNPSIPKGTGISVTSTLDELKKSGLDIKI